MFFQNCGCFAGSQRNTSFLTKMEEVHYDATALHKRLSSKQRKVFDMWREEAGCWTDIYAIRQKLIELLNVECELKDLTDVHVEKEEESDARFVGFHITKADYGEVTLSMYRCVYMDDEDRDKLIDSPDFVRCPGTNVHKFFEKKYIFGQYFRPKDSLYYVMIVADKPLGDWTSNGSCDYSVAVEGPSCNWPTLYKKKAKKRSLKNE